VWDYIRLDFTELNNSLSTAPFSTAFLVFDDIYDIIQYTYDFLFSILREHIINKNGTIRPKDKSWMFNEVRHALRFRAFSRYKKKVPTDENKLRFIIARREANRLKREAINRYSENAVNKLSDDKLDVKKFWSLSKSILGSKSQHCIPPLIENSSTISDDVHRAELFNEFFSSHMRLHDTNPPPLPHFELLCNNKLEVLETSESEVLKLLSKINIHKSSGSDDLNNIILRKCAHTLM
jgi:hypothetical protein